MLLKSFSRACLHENSSSGEKNSFEKFISYSKVDGLMDCTEQNLEFYRHSHTKKSHIDTSIAGTWMFS